MTPEQLLGKELESSAVEQFLQSLGAEPDEDEDESRVFWDDPKRGLLLRAEPTTRKVTTVYLYFTGHDDYADYTGPMPLELRPDMSRAELEAKLGAGRDPEGKGQELVWDGDDFNVSVEFRKDNRIRLIAVYYA